MITIFMGWPRWTMKGLPAGSVMQESPKGPNLTIEQLPPEIFGEIGKDLKVVDVLCFSSTSRTVKQKLDLDLPRLQRQITLPHELEYKLRLEKDRPDWILCATCGILHRRLRNDALLGSVATMSRPERACASSFSGYLDVTFGYHHYRLWREVFDLVLRAHEYGPEYGLPLSSLNYRCDMANYGHSRTHVRVECTPKIVKSRLFLKIHFFVTVDFRRPLWHQIDNQARIHLCRHLGAPHLDRSKETCFVTHVDHEDCARCREVWGCRKCATEGAVKIVRAHSDQIGTLEIIAWKDLGSRGCPLTQPWIGHTSIRWDNGCTFEPAPPGSLKEMYETAE